MSLRARILYKNLSQILDQNKLEKTYFSDILVLKWIKIVNGQLPQTDLPTQKNGYGNFFRMYLPIVDIVPKGILKSLNEFNHGVKYPSPSSSDIN